MKCSERESVRYVLAGGFNTAATYTAYVVLLPVVGYAISYTVSYAAGIFLAYCLSARFVFRRPLQWRHAIQYPVVYVLQYGLGITLTAVLIDGMHLNAEFAAALAIAVSVPFTFWLSRWIIKRREHPGPAVAP